MFFIFVLYRLVNGGHHGHGGGQSLLRDETDDEDEDIEPDVVGDSPPTSPSVSISPASPPSSSTGPDPRENGNPA